MGGNGNGLRSRGYEVRILAAAPRRAGLAVASGVRAGGIFVNHARRLLIIQGGGKTAAQADPGAHLDRLAQIAPPEEWRPAVGYEGRYEVSDRGRVRSLARSGVRRTRLLRPARNHHGYLRASLRDADGKLRHVFVHLLVAAAFIGPLPYPGATVDHLDRDKRNNAPGNLEYVTRLENYRRHLRRAREALEDTLDLFAAPVRQAAGGAQ